MARIKVVEGLPPASRYGTFAIDLEIFNANPKQLHRPAGDFACLGLSDGQTTYMVTKASDVEKALSRISRCRWVFHNASFDIRHLRRWADIPVRSSDLFWDTFIIEKILWGGWYDSFALNDLYRRYTGQYLSKAIRKEFHKATVLTGDMLDYAAKDPPATLKVRGEQARELAKDEGSQRIWRDVDAPCFWATLDFRGVYVNQRKWKALTEKWIAKAEEIQGEFKINLNAPGQVLRLLHEKGLTKLDSTNEKFLVKYADHPTVAKVREYREASKRASSYGDNILDMVEDDGRLYSNFKTTEAETGRTACEGPNLQNQPNEYDYRDCYEAERGNSFIAEDYERQEPNVLAEYSRDPELMRALAAGENLHMTAASAIFTYPVQEYDERHRKTPEYKTGKALNLGLSYGMTAKGLAFQTGRPVEECEVLIRNYFTRLRGVKNYIDRYRQIGRQDGFVRSLMGRRIWLNWYGYQAPNNAINAPIQASGADMIKLSVVDLHQQWLALKRRGPFWLIGPIHDENIAEDDKATAKATAKRIETAMVKAYHTVCPSITAKDIVSVYIGKSWAGKA